MPVVGAGEVGPEVLRAVEQTRNAAVGGAAVLALFDDADQVPGRVRIALHVAPPVIGAAEAGVQQQPVGHRRRPAGLRHAQRLGRADAARFRRDARGIGDAGRQPAAFPAVRLLVPEAADLVAGGRLPRHAAADVLVGPVGERRPARVRRVQPFRRIAGVQVVVDVGDDPGAALGARVHEVPHPVLLDRTAEGSIDVVDLGERRRRVEAGGDQLVVEVVARQLFSREAEEGRTRDRVAAGFGHHVHHQAGGLGLPQTSGGRERDFLGVADIGHIRGRLVAAGRVPHVEPVNRETALVGAAAVDGKLRRRRSRHDVVQVGGDAGDDRHHRVVTADRRDRLEHVVVQRHFPFGALDVHDRGFAGDGDRFRERADLEIGVDRRRERPGQLDALALEGAESRQREGDRVGPGPQILDPILPGPVADRRSYFLDQCRAGGLDVDAGEDGPGRVLHRARDDRLCEGGGWNHADRRQQCQGPRDRAHLPPHSSLARVNAERLDHPAHRLRSTGWDSRGRYTLAIHGSQAALGDDSQVAGNPGGGFKKLNRGRIAELCTSAPAGV